MRRHEHLLFAGSLAVSMFLPRESPAQHYEYAVKIICGRPDSTLVRLTPQTYATTINVRNPLGSPVAVFSKRISLTVPPGRQRPGTVRELAVDTLRDEEALVIDCLDLRRRQVGTSFEGFLVIKSPVSLDVTAVYTVPGSIDVEQIRERRGP